MHPASRPRLLVLVGLGLVGVLLGLVGAGVITLERRIGSVLVPWGLVLAVVGVAVTVRGSAWLVGSRRGGVAVLLGWLLPTLALSAVNPGGDVVLTDERRTYVYLIATFALGLLAASWPLPPGAAELAVREPASYDGTDADDEPWYDGDAPDAGPTAPTVDAAPDPTTRLD